MDKIVIYQVFTRLFGNNTPSCTPHGSKEENGVGKMADFTMKALGQIKSLGASHIWYTGVIEHATCTNYSSYGIQKDHPAVVKGLAGSPYAIKDYYDVDPDLANSVENRMKEFENLVQRTHRAGLKVVIDFVPNHVARQYSSDNAPKGVVGLGDDDCTDYAFHPQNNFYYLPSTPLQPSFDVADYVESPARATGNNVFCATPSRNDWYETIKLNYGVDYMAGGVPCFEPIPNTWHKMLDILLYWASKKVDAFRCDMAEMVPVEFWHWVIPQVKEKFQHIQFIAEVYNPDQYRSYIHHGNFDYLYDKVGLYDTLRSVVNGYASTQDITRCWQQVDDIRSHMLYFLENHDEQRLASDFFAGEPLKGRAPLLVAALMYSNPFMLYFGQELGERGMDEEGFSGLDGRTTIFDYWTVDSIRRWRNKGKFDEALLTESERELRNYYMRVLQLCNTSQAISQGAVYDLMYANPHLHRQYLFFRYQGDETCLIVANFSENAETVDIHIPSHFFEHTELTATDKAEWVDLLTEQVVTTSFNNTEPMTLTLPAWGGVVLKLN